MMEWRQSISQLGYLCWIEKTAFDLMWAKKAKDIAAVKASTAFAKAKRSGIKGAQLAPLKSAQDAAVAASAQAKAAFESDLRRRVIAITSHMFFAYHGIKLISKHTTLEEAQAALGA